MRDSYRLLAIAILTQAFHDAKRDPEAREWLLQGDALSLLDLLGIELPADYPAWVLGGCGKDFFRKD